jgi:NADH:ubiquinone oxidoreductase subunit 2 (subunit N)
MPYSELIIGLTALLQGMLLVMPRGFAARRGTEMLSVFGLGLAALVLLASLGSPPVAFSFEMLEDQALFRMPRAAMLLASVLLGRVVVSTRELPESRKPEVLFLFTLLAFLCDLLMLSRHCALSILLLVLSSWVGLFLGGLAYRGRLEGEAVLKFWIQASLSLTIGFGAILLLSLVAGGANFSVIGEYMRAQDRYSPQALLVVAGLFLPFLMAGGFFPFHFITIDRDHGLPWAVQTALSVIFQGSVAVAVWKMGVMVFGHVSSPGAGISEGMRVLQLCGLIGGFWLSIFALSQDNSKRLYSALIGAQWSAVLAAGALPSLLNVSAVTYALSASFVWCAVLGVVWSRFQEWAGDEKITAVHGAAKSFRASGLLLLLALASPLFVPGFPGFPSALYLLAAMIEQKSLVFLATYAGLLSLVCLICIRIGTDLLFRDRAPQTLNRGADSFLAYNALDWSVIGGTAALLLAGGLFWHPVLESLGGAAKVFLQ